LAICLIYRGFALRVVPVATVWSQGRDEQHVV
jgi:hypothetical protein